MSRADEALSALSHELRTPLAAITGFAELLQARDDEQIRAEATDRILEAAEQLSTAIERLLQAIAAGGDELVLRVAEPEERT